MSPGTCSRPGLMRRLTRSMSSDRSVRTTSGTSRCEARLPPPQPSSSSVARRAGAAGGEQPDDVVRLVGVLPWRRDQVVPVGEVGVEAHRRHATAARVAGDVRSGARYARRLRTHAQKDRACHDSASCPCSPCSRSPRASCWPRAATTTTMPPRAPPPRPTAAVCEKDSLQTKTAGTLDGRDRLAGVRAVRRGRRPDQRRGLRERRGLRDRRPARLHEGRGEVDPRAVQLDLRAGPEEVRLRREPGLDQPGAPAGRRLLVAVLHDPAGRAGGRRLRLRLRDDRRRPEGRPDRRAGRHDEPRRRQRGDRADASSRASTTTRPTSSARSRTARWTRSSTDLPTTIYLRDVEVEGSKLVGQFSAPGGDDWGAVLEKGSPLTRRASPRRSTALRTRASSSRSPTSGSGPRRPRSSRRGRATAEPVSTAAERRVAREAARRRHARARRGGRRRVVGRRARRPGGGASSPAPAGTRSSRRSSRGRPVPRQLPRRSCGRSGWT